SRSLNSVTREVTPLTMAILPQYDENGCSGSHILEEFEEYFVNYSPSKMVDYACKFFGATLRGRQIGTREISSMTHKVPISIDHSTGMYFFPTLSPVNPKCAWIAHTHVDKINEAPNQCTEIVFNNGKRIVVDVSFGSMVNQVNRTAQFRYMLDNRIKRLYSNQGQGKGGLFD